MMGRSQRQGVWLSVMAAGMLATADLPIGVPIGVNDLVDEPIRVETKRATVSKEKCDRAAPRTVSPTAARKTTIARNERGFRFLRWLL